MKKRTGSNIYNRWRPRRFDEFVGNVQVVKAIQDLMKRPDPPKSWLFHGPSGTGKTSMARVVAASINCQGAIKPCGECGPCEQLFANAWPDYYEINCANRRGIDAMRDLEDMMRFAPVAKAKVYCLDEVQQVTREGANTLLKVFEDGIGSNIIILCTTEPQDILPTLRTRAISFEFKPWNRDDAQQVAEEVFAGEGMKVSEATLGKFRERAFDLGIDSPRAFLNAIEKCIAAKSLDVLDAFTESTPEVISVCRGVFNGDWPAVTRAWSPAFDAEQVRIAVCGYLRSVLLKETNMDKALAIAEALKEIAVRVEDSRQENNILARLCLATVRLQLDRAERGN
jgi:DNA polymerase III subunit gamma/tau